MPFTKLTIAGFTQTPHMLAMLDNKDLSQSGFLPRFNTFLLNPKYTNIEETSDIQDDIRRQLNVTIQVIDMWHQDSLYSSKVKYLVMRI